MAEIIQDLKLQNDPTTIVRPNIVTGSIPAGAVTGDKIANGTITGANLASYCVDTTNIVVGAVTTYKIATGAVTEDKIATGAVTSSKIGITAVQTSNIAQGAVTRAKISRTDNYVIDDDFGDDIDDFITYFTRLFKSGFRFYFDDENGYIVQVDSIEIGPHSVTLYSKYPLQGMQDEQIIDSSNFSTYFVGGGNGTLLHYCGA